MIALLSKIWPLLAGIGGFIGLFLGKRFYDNSIKKETRSEITNELLTESAVKLKKFIEQETKTANDLEPLITRVSDTWGDASGVSEKTSVTKVRTSPKNRNRSTVRKPKQ